MGRKKRLPRKLPRRYRAAFPNLKNYVITSPEDPTYNCIAFASESDQLWWEPLKIPEPGFHWPRKIEANTNDDGIQGLIRCFNTLGYEACDEDKLEDGFQKVALYAITEDDWTHASIQDNSGAWNSKLGDGYDIRHETPHCVAGPTYGRVICYLKRKVATKRP
jgi:hypothetical protein